MLRNSTARADEMTATTLAAMIAFASWLENCACSRNSTSAERPPQTRIVSRTTPTAPSFSTETSILRAWNRTMTPNSASG
jgi:hypothetical protein